MSTFHPCSSTTGLRGPQLFTVLVEDSKVIREALIPTLSDLAGVAVVAVAETATDAVATLRSLDTDWDLAIVDLFLREGSGLAVLEACKARASYQKMVVLTNYPTAEMRRRALEAGADALFDKSAEFDLFFDWCVSGRTNGATAQLT